MIVIPTVPSRGVVESCAWMRGALHGWICRWNAEALRHPPHEVDVVRQHTPV